MPHGLKRYQNLDHDHPITISCYHRRPYLQTSRSRDLFEHSLEQSRRKYRFDILACVVMPEHVHLLVSEPPKEPLSKAIQAIKLSVSKQSIPRPFWQIRYHDFNVFTQPKRIEKIRYLHRNPVIRSLTIEAETGPTPATARISTANNAPFKSPSDWHAKPGCPIFATASSSLMWVPTGCGPLTTHLEAETSLTA